MERLSESLETTRDDFSNDVSNYIVVTHRKVYKG